MPRPTAAAIVAALRAEGLTVVETPGWAARGYDVLDPVGQLNHHTAGGRGPTDQRDVDECIHGRADLPGPLCNGLIGKDGTVHLIAYRRARHAGRGSKVVLDELLRDVRPTGDARDRGLVDDADGNRWLWGWEVDHPGDTTPYPPVQIDALVRANTALARAHGWTANRSIHHRQWTRRKTDMSWRGDLVAAIAARLTPPAPAAGGAGTV